MRDACRCPSYPGAPGVSWAQPHGRAYRTTPGGPPPAARPIRRSSRSPILLLIPVVLLASGLMAIVLAPPFVGAAVGVKRIDDKVTALGADFTRIPRFPERSTIYAATARPCSPPSTSTTASSCASRTVSQPAQACRARHRGLGLLPARRAQLDLAVARAGRERARRAGRRGRLDHHAAAREEHAGSRPLRPDLRAQAAGVRAGDPRGEEVHEGPDLRAVPQPDLPGERRLRDRHRRRVLLRQAGLGADARRRAPCSRGSSGLPTYYDPISAPAAGHGFAATTSSTACSARASLAGAQRDAEAQAARPRQGRGRFRKNDAAVLRDLSRRARSSRTPTGSSTRSASPRRRASASSIEGGLSITTTFDPKWQAYAQAAANAPYAGATPYHPPGSLPPDVAIVSQDVKTGAIRTLLSGRNYAQDTAGPGEHARTRRGRRSSRTSWRPPSRKASRPRRRTPASRRTTRPDGWPGSSCNCVTNAEGPGDSGLINLYTATTDSVNVVFAQLIQDVGPDNVVDVAHRMGVTSELLPVALARHRLGPGDAAGPGLRVPDARERRRALQPVHRREHLRRPRHRLPAPSRTAPP